MPAKSTHSTTALLDKLQVTYPELSFIESSQFSWHAGKRHISYRRETAEDAQGIWALLHELGHALLDHRDYETDIELLHLESAAWQKAKEVAREHHVAIDPEYIEDCLDSYRDWLHIRATCPSCYVRALQASRTTYSCHNCATQWHVTRSRLCRPYRRKN
jgi:hypothetical protein